MILKEKKCFESDRILPDVIKQLNNILNGDLVSNKNYISTPLKDKTQLDTR